MSDDIELKKNDMNIRIHTKLTEEYIRDNPIPVIPFPQHKHFHNHNNPQCYTWLMHFFHFCFGVLVGLYVGSYSPIY